MCSRDENKITWLFSWLFQGYLDYPKKKYGPRSHKEKRFWDNKILKELINDVFNDKGHLMKDLDELKDKHEDLVSQQNEMIDSAFDRIITEACSVDLGLVMLIVEKWVDKFDYFKRFRDRKGIPCTSFRKPIKAT